MARELPSSAPVRCSVMGWSIEGRRVIVTGGNAGIGRAAAEALSNAGALVTIAARNRAKAGMAADAIESSSGVPVDTLEVDLADLASVRAAADTFLATHDDAAVLINNAGGMFGRRGSTVDGHERTIATNYLGPFLLTQLLIDRLRACSPSRIINVASSGHGYAKEGIRFGDFEWTDRYRMMEVYGHSKLANILHARELERRYGPDGVHAYAMHPGLVRTSIGRGGDSLRISLAVRFAGPRMRSPEEGADTAVWLATEDPLPEPCGGYFEDRTEARSSRHARDDEMARRLWDETEALVMTRTDESGTAS